jgi:hypothetical protein
VSRRDSHCFRTQMPPSGPPSLPVWLRNRKLTFPISCLRLMYTHPSSSMYKPVTSVPSFRNSTISPPCLTARPSSLSARSTLQLHPRPEGTSEFCLSCASEFEIPNKLKIATNRLKQPAPRMAEIGPRRRCRSPAGAAALWEVDLRPRQTHDLLDAQRRRQCEALDDRKLGAGRLVEARLLSYHSGLRSRPSFSFNAVFVPI